MLLSLLRLRLLLRLGLGLLGFESLSVLTFGLDGVLFLAGAFTDLGLLVSLFLLLGLSLRLGRSSFIAGAVFVAVSAENAELSVLVRLLGLRFLLRLLRDLG